ncbi:MAG: dihydrodipicolinate synthase family protein [Rhodothermaceae bacterium]|nr:dihydrodipicolinate synthase family protein [Rhodothermaceae bacterium]
MPNKAAIFAGCAPAIMTPCDADGQPDFDELVRVAQLLIAKGMKAVIWAGSMGGWPNLSVEGRKEGVRRLVEAGIPVIVGTGHQNPLVSVEFAKHANQVGAAGLMVIPRQSSRVACEPAQYEHFSAILEAAGEMPCVIYNSKYYGFEVRAGLFFRLRDRFKNLVGFKEFCGAEALFYAATNITSGDDDLILAVGVDTAVCYGYLNCGATGAITGIGNILPEQVLYMIKLCEWAASGVEGASHARRLALELEEAFGVLAKYDEGPDLVLYYKYLMVLAGFDKFEHSLIPTDKLSNSQKLHAQSQYNQFLHWWADWEGRPFCETHIQLI